MVYIFVFNFFGLFRIIVFSKVVKIRDKILEAFKLKSILQRRYSRALNLSLAFIEIIECDLQ